MRVDVVLLPSDLQAKHREGRAVVVFDVLRATTSMVAALAAQVKEIRIYGDVPSAAAARAAYGGPALLCGEIDALPPAGFDLGNSPPAFTAELHAGRTMFISTTNGTKAILSALGAKAIFIGALVNASAAARAIIESGLDVTLLCSGTAGEVSMEDLLGCGAVLHTLAQHRPLIDGSDLVRIARRLFDSARGDLLGALQESQGGHNVLKVGLGPDIEFAAKLDRFNIVGRVSGNPPVVRQFVTA